METVRLIIDEHISFKSQLFKLAKSDLVKTYRGAALGWIWAVIKPMITLFVFWFAFSVGLRRGEPVNGYSFFLWLLAGFLPWFYMQEMIPCGAECIRKYRHLVTKMKFPVSTIPTYVSISHLIVNIVLLGVTILIFWMYGYAPDVYYLQLPFYILIMFLFFTVWSLFAGMLASISKDFLNLVRAFTSAIFWMSGIIYNVDSIASPTIRLLLKFNPVTVVATGYRYCFIYKTWFWEDKTSLICYSITLAVFVVGALWAYGKLRKEVPDVL